MKELKTRKLAGDDMLIVLRIYTYYPFGTSFSCHDIEVYDLK